MTQSAYIYLVTNTTNGKQYVGFTTQLIQRMQRHSGYQKDTMDDHFHRAIRKYGWDAFDVDVIFEHDDAEFTLTVMEPYYIQWYNTYENGYNSDLGGRGCLGYKHTNAHRKYMSKKYSGPGNPFYGHKLTDAHKAKIVHRDLDHPSARPILCVSPEGNHYRFDCMKFAVKSLRKLVNKKFYSSAMTMVAQGKRKHHHNWTFHYL